MNDAVVRPVLRLLHQTRSHRIRSYVFPFFGVALLIPQTMMEAVYLKTRRTIAELTPEFTFPERDPTLDRNVVIFRGAKEVNVIGHDDVSADHPSISFAPRFQQRIMNAGVRQLRFALSRADRDENDRSLTAEDENAFRGVMSLS